MAKDEKPNLRVLRSFRGPDAVAVPVDTVFPKAALEEADWQTLAHMTPPRVEETADPVTADEDSPKRKSRPSILPGGGT